MNLCSRFGPSGGRNRKPHCGCYLACQIEVFHIFGLDPPVHMKEVLSGRKRRIDVKVVDEGGVVDDDGTQAISRLRDRRTNRDSDDCSSCVWFFKGRCA